jgi:hypothetical protein
MAHAPTPMGVNSISLVPSRFFCISSTITKVARFGETTPESAEAIERGGKNPRRDAHAAFDPQTK